MERFFLVISSGSVPLGGLKFLDTGRDGSGRVQIVRFRGRLGATRRHAYSKTGRPNTE
jgi:hypothetical protein